MEATEASQLAAPGWSASSYCVGCSVAGMGRRTRQALRHFPSYLRCAFTGRCSAPRRVFVKRTGAIFGDGWAEASVGGRYHGTME